MTSCQQAMIAGGQRLRINMSGSFSNFGSSSPVTTVASALATGGAGPKSYLWEWISGPTPSAITIVSPTSASTTLSAVLGPDASTGGTIRCTATDLTGSVSATATVNLTRLP